MAMVLVGLMDCFVNHDDVIAYFKNRMKYINLLNSFCLYLLFSVYILFLLAYKVEVYSV